MMADIGYGLLMLLGSWLFLKKNGRTTAALWR